MKNQGTLALSLTLLILGLVVVILMQNGSNPSGDSEGAVAAVDRELVTLLRELNESQQESRAVMQELVVSLASISKQASRAPSSREVVGGLPAPSLDELVASLDALRVSIESNSQQTRDMLQTTIGDAGESLVETKERNTLTNWPALEGLEHEWRANPDQATREQYLQTARDLLEAYGPPTAIYRPKSGLLFHYRRHAEGAPGVEWYFRMQDGIVIEFYVEDSVGEQVE